MPKIEKSLTVLDRVTSGGSAGYITVDPRALLLVTVIYLCFILGVPSMHLDILLWFALYPIISAPLFGMTYGSVFMQSLIVLPLVLLLGMFNPIVDKTPVVALQNMSVTRGWLLFWGIIIRGLLSMQALLILIRAIGFVGIVRALGRLGVPRFLVTQLLMVFRYIRVLIEEGLTMKSARDARSYGNRHLSIRMWGVLIGQLFLRSVDRAERVHKAMLARGFSAEIPLDYSMSTGMGDTEPTTKGWTMSSTVFLIVWSLVFLFLRLFNLSLLFVK